MSKVRLMQRKIKMWKGRSKKRCTNDQTREEKRKKTVIKGRMEEQ